MTVLSSDTFQRPDQVGLGTSSDGEVWTTDRVDSVSSVVSHQASIQTLDGGDMSWFLGNGTAATVNISVRMQVSNGAVGPIFRGASNGGFFNGYQAPIFGNSLLFVIEASASHNVIQNVTIPGFDNSKFWWVRCVMVGNAYSARVWQDGTQEPSSWLFQGTDNTYATGGWGLGTNQSTAAFIDNFVVTDNQASGTTVTKTLQLRALLRTQKTLTVPVLARLSTQASKTLQIRCNLRGITKTVQIRAIVASPVPPTTNALLKVRSGAITTLVRSGNALVGVRT